MVGSDAADGVTSFEFPVTGSSLRDVGYWMLDGGACARGRFTYRPPPLAGRSEWGGFLRVPYCITLEDFDIGAYIGRAMVREDHFALQ